jgi:5'-3' exoribonuclease 2
MVSDLVNLTEIKVVFRLGRPFKPYQQLLGCLPAASAKALPLSYRWTFIRFLMWLS